MQKLCSECKRAFVLQPDDIGFYEQMKVKAPSMCPRCGIERVAAWRNERNLFHRACDKCKKPGLSMYSPDKPYLVYCHDCWWKDDWSGGDYAQDYDPSRSLFEQLKELQKKVPREALVIVNSSNSDFANHCRDSKDVYFTFLVSKSENILYSMWIVAKDVMDCHKLLRSELTLHSVDVSGLNHCAYIHDSADSSDCYFSYDLRGCSNCIFSYNLRNKSYCIRNQQFSKEDYGREKEKILNGSYAQHLRNLEEYGHVHERAIRRFQNSIKSQGVAGNNLEGCGKCDWIFDGFNCEHCRYVGSILNAKNVQYSYSIGTQPCEFLYGCATIKGGTNDTFSFNCLTSSDCHWCDSLISSSNCAASVGLKHGEYSILNKRYPKEEYEKILADLRAKGEITDFPPKEFSCFAYNETAACDYYPKTKEKAIAAGYTWQDNFPTTTGQETLAPEAIPDNIRDAKDEITKEVLRCTTCARNYRVIQRELDLLRRFNLPLPRECPQCRMSARRAMRLPWDFSTRPCDKCGTEMQTAYSSDRKEKVYCESCYNQEVV